jgi:hypothetical protein
MNRSWRALDDERLTIIPASSRAFEFRGRRSPRATTNERDAVYFECC